MKGSAAETYNLSFSGAVHFCLSRYLIDNRWFKQWKKYVGFDSWDMYNVGEHNMFPGPIDNSGLFSGTVSCCFSFFLLSV